jgi:hypothetical protein
MPATTFTTRLLLRKPDPDPTTGDLINVVTDINNSMDKLDAVVGATVCTSGTRPTGADRWDGRQIYETDTRRNYMWSAAVTTWLPLLIGRGTDGPYLLGQSTDTSGEGINVRGSAAGTHMWRSRVTSDANPRFNIMADGKMEWGPGSSIVDVNLFRSATGILGTDFALKVSGDYVCGSENGVSQVATSSGTTTTNSSSYVNMAGTGAVTSFSFVKRFTATRVRIDMSATFYTSTAGCGARFGVLVNGTDYDVCQLAGNVPAASTHLHAGGFAYIPAGLAAGTYTVQGRWKWIVLTGTLTRDTNDWLSISARECN